MFDYSYGNGFAASGSIGGYNISIGQPSIYYPQTGGVYYPQNTGGVYQAGLGWSSGSNDNSLWLLLGAVVLFMIASK